MSSSEKWTVVSSRRRRGRRARNLGDVEHEGGERTVAHAETSDLAADPLPWMPADAEEDQARVSTILQKLHSSLSRLLSSAFYLRFASQLREAIREKLLQVAPPPGKIRVVLYGVGSIENHEPPRLQFSLAMLLRRELGDSVGEIEVFDPILSAAECAAVEAMGCTVPRFNDCGRRRVDSPTLFYMPHCELSLYGNVLSANLAEFPSVGQIVVLGNSFKMYEDLANVKSGSITRKHLDFNRLQDARYSIEEINVAGRGSDEQDTLVRAFSDTSWHFFRRRQIEEADICAPEAELCRVSAAASRSSIVD